MGAKVKNNVIPPVWMNNKKKSFIHLSHKNTRSRYNKSNVYESTGKAAP